MDEEYLLWKEGRDFICPFDGSDPSALKIVLQT